MRDASKPLAVLLLLCGLGTGAFAADDLWKMAMAHASPESSRRADRLMMRSLERGRDGEFASETVMTFSRDDSGDRYVLVSAFEDGKDVTERERRRGERREGDEEDPFVHQMFNPEKTAGLTLSPREAAGIVGGRECRIYDYRFEYEMKMGGGEPKSVIERGMLLLDLENGMPLRIEGTLEEGPPMIDSFTYRLEAASGPDGAWRPLVMEMDFSARMIVRKAGVFRMEFLYED